jgi:N-acetylglucosamine-6-phosphate deacetylase
MTLVLRGGTALTDEGLRDAEVVIDRGVITGLETAGEGAARHATTGAVLDVDGCLVAPGFVDLQCNGAGGIDLTATPEALWDVAALLPQWGVTAWQPTIVSSPPDVRRRAIAALRAHEPRDVPVARPLGLHFEGPFLAPAHRGAHDPNQLAVPSHDAVAGWSRDAGVAMVTLAPELPGALDVVRTLVDRGVVVAAGHSGASLAEARAGFAAGVSFVTHLFNGMKALHHRDPGLVGAALGDERVRLGLIVDGVHVDPSVVLLAWRLCRDRIAVVTDAVAPLGVTGRDAARLDDGTLAGATTSMDQAVRNLVAFSGCTLPEAAAAAAPTSSPLRLGGPADVVVLTAEGAVVATVVGGMVAWTR